MPNTASAAQDAANEESRMSPAATGVVRTMCPMNCHPTLCGMLAEVRDRELVGVSGDPANPDSRGFLCIRGQASREVIGNPARLLHPLMRDSRSEPFRRATWEEAYARIVVSINSAPPQATAIWPGHGSITTSYGTRFGPQLMARFANLHGSQFWNPTMICWGLGAFGLALTGVLETNTKEDMGEHSQLILLWAANLASQPNTARHLLEAKRRGAHIVTIDVRHTEAAAKSDEVFLVRPGTDAALALALIHVICQERLHDSAFVEQHTVGFSALAQQVKAYSPAWAESITGIAAPRIVELARRYAATKPAMIVLGGSSMHKGGNGWQASRAIACLPALTGNLGVAGGGFGPRHGSAAHGRGLGSIAAAERRRPGTAWPNQMSDVLAALREGRVRTLLQMGSNMLSSFPDAAAAAEGLARTGLIVSHDLFLNATAQQFADVVLPGTAWLEELGAKATHTHLYLMERALAPAGETRSLYRVLSELAQQLGVSDFHPWADEEGMINAVLDHPCTGRATVASLREAGGFVAMNVSHVAYPTAKFDTPSGKVEFESELARDLGLPVLPRFESPALDGVGAPAGERARHPLVLTQGRTLGHFHAFYNNGQALPTLSRREAEPAVWISPADAAARGVGDGAAIRVFNQRGELLARAHVTPRIPAGTLWLRDGWPGLNSLTASAPVLPDAAVDAFGFSAGQATFDARVELAALARDSAV
jgi:anaerobic selenocysteine-containing dehydrogenase